MALSTSISVVPEWSYGSCQGYSCPSNSASRNLALAGQPGGSFGSGDNRLIACIYRDSVNGNVRCSYNFGQWNGNRNGGFGGECPAQLYCNGDCATASLFANRQCGVCPAEYEISENTCLFTCPSGTYIEPGSTTTPPNCLPCNSITTASTAGYALNSQGQCAPSTCNTGYGLNDGTTCSACPSGSFSPDPTSACQTCPPGYFVADDGRSCTTITCDPGYGVQGKTCVACQTNPDYNEGQAGDQYLLYGATVSPGGPGAVCANCQGATYPNAALTHCDPLDCAPGSGIYGDYNGLGQYCDVCYLNEYYSSFGPSYQYYTYSATVSPGGTASCDYCQGATVANVALTACEPLTCDKGSGGVNEGLGGYCVSCSEGQYSAGGSNICKDCASPNIVSSDHSACNLPPSINARLKARGNRVQSGLKGDTAAKAVPIPIKRKRFDSWA